MRTASLRGKRLIGWELWIFLRFCICASSSWIRFRRISLTCRTHTVQFGKPSHRGGKRHWCQCVTRTWKPSAQCMLKQRKLPPVCPFTRYQWHFTSETGIFSTPNLQNCNTTPGGLRQISTCPQVPLQVNFYEKPTFGVWCLYSYLVHIIS